MRRVLVLRPEPGASATVERARERGLAAIAAPLFEIEPLAWETPDPAAFDGLLLTSANSLRSSGDRLKTLRGLPVYAVGEATAEAARQAGFSIAGTGDGDVERLLASIGAGLKLLHLCGEDRRVPPTVRQQITPVTVYRAKPIEAPAVGVLEEVLVLIHSPRTGRRFAELVGDRRSITIAAISPAAAAAMGDGWDAVEAAPEPNDDALLALAARLCNKPPPE